MDEKFLRSIGFTGFVMGERSKRDGIKRLCWTAILSEGESLVIRLKKHNEDWVLDLVKRYGKNGKELENKYFDSKSITDAIKFVRETGTANFG